MGQCHWLSVRDQPRPAGPQRLPGDPNYGFPEEDEEALGSLDDVRRELDDVVDTTSSRYATLTTDEMNVKAGWSGYPETIGFDNGAGRHTSTSTRSRSRRRSTCWASAEVRSRGCTRLNAQAFGRLGATVFGRSSAGDAAPVLEQVARDLNELRISVVAAAEAGVPRRGLVIGT